MVAMVDFTLITHSIYHHAIVQLLSWRHESRIFNSFDKIRIVV